MKVVLDGAQLSVVYNPEVPIQITGSIFVDSKTPEYTGTIRELQFSGGGIVRFPSDSIFIVIDKRIIKIRDSSWLDGDEVLEIMDDEDISLDGAECVYNKKYMKIYVKKDGPFERKIVYIVPLDTYYHVLPTSVDYKIFLHYVGRGVFIHGDGNNYRIVGNAVISFARSANADGLITYETELQQINNFKLLRKRISGKPRYVWPIKDGKVKMYLPIFEQIKDQYKGKPIIKDETVEIDVASLTLGTKFRIENSYLMMF